MANDNKKDKRAGAESGGTQNTSHDYRTTAADDLQRRLDDTERELGILGETDAADEIAAADASVALNEPADCATVAEFLHALGVEKRKAAAIARAYEVRPSADVERSLGLAVKYAAGLEHGERPVTANIHGGHRKRLRASASSDRELWSFSDIEILETLLSFIIPQRDTNPMAHALLDKFGSLLGVFRATESELYAVRGVTHAAAELLPMLVAICLWSGARNVRICGHDDAVCFFGSIYFGGELEGTSAAYLDGGFGLVAVEQLKSGLKDLRPVIGSVSKYSARYVIISRRETELFPMHFERVEDVDRLKRALTAIGVRLLDCMVFCDCGYYSLGASAVMRDAQPRYTFVPTHAASHAPELARELIDE